MSYRKNKKRFDTVSEMIEKTDPKHEEWVKENFSTETKDKGGFYGVSYDEAKEMIDEGWGEGAVRVSKLRAELSETVDSVISKNAATIQFDAEGEWVDLGRLATDDPECCGYFTSGGSVGGDKVVQIIANVSVSCSVSHETMFCRGAATVAAVDILESLGYRVHLVAAMGVKNRTKRELLDVQVTIKEPTQPVDQDRLAFTLCHPSFFRRIMFKVMESEDHRPGRTYPHSVEADADGAVVLPELLTGRTPTREETIEQVKMICRKTGIEIDEPEAF